MSASNTISMVDKTWIKVATVEDFPPNGGRCFKHKGEQIAIYRFSRKNQWFATQNLCPHKQEMVLSRGLLGDHDGIPKVACPLHKANFDLTNGCHLNGDLPPLKTYEVMVEAGVVYIKDSSL